MSMPHTGGWIVFSVLILVMLALDLGVFNRRPHAVKSKEALRWTTLWLVISLLFALGLYLTEGPEHSLQFLTGYFIEKSLSLDNVFVFVTVFQYFSIPLIYQHRVLFYGILGAILMRGLFIWAGLEVLKLFSWVFYIFGLFLIFTALKMMRMNHDNRSLQNNSLIKYLKNHLPVSESLHGQKFFVVEKGKRLITPLFLSLIFIELSDVLFALDSVPAIFAITTDPFLVYTSNIFAILGLRSLYFVLAHIIPKFRYLKTGLSLILLFIGSKLMVHQFFPIPTILSLAVIISILALSIVISYVRLPRAFQKGKK